MSIEESIRKAFPLVNSVSISDEFIEEHQNIMELRNDPELFAYVPAYMLWCVRNGDMKLVDMFTVNTLAEYGRCKDPENGYLNFMHRCSAEQRSIVSSFLEWCLKEIITSDETQIDRALKNWKQ